MAVLNQASLLVLFPVEFAHFVSLYPILIIQTIFQTFSLLLHCYGDPWSETFDITIAIVWGCHKSYPLKIVNLISKHVSWLLSKPPFTHLPVILGLYTAILTSGQLIILHWPFSVRVKKKSCKSLTLKEKLEMIKLSEEGASKAKTGGQLCLLWQIVSQVVDAKEKFLKEVWSAAPVNTWMISVTALLLIGIKS